MGLSNAGPQGLRVFNLRPLELSTEAPLFRISGGTTVTSFDHRLNDIPENPLVIYLHFNLEIAI